MHCVCARCCHFRQRFARNISDCTPHVHVHVRVEHHNSIINIAIKPSTSTRQLGVDFIIFHHPKQQHNSNNNDTTQHRLQAEEEHLWQDVAALRTDVDSIQIIIQAMLRQQQVRNIGGDVRYSMLNAGVRHAEASSHPPPASPRAPPLSFPLLSWRRIHRLY